MKHIILFIKMIVYYPAIKLSTLHLNRNDFDLNQTSAKMWATILLKLVKVKVDTVHINHIPLEDGFIFVTNENNPYDAILLLSVFPINIGFILYKKTKIPYLKNWFKRIFTLFIEQNYNFMENIDEVENHIIKSGNLIVYLNQLEQLNSLLSFIDYAYHTKKTLIPIRISETRNIMRKGNYHKTLVDICLPLHFEEYQSMTKSDCVNELKERMA